MPDFWTINRSFLMDWSSIFKGPTGCWFQGGKVLGFLDLKIKPTGLTGLHLSNEGLRDEQKKTSHVWRFHLIFEAFPIKTNTFFAPFGSRKFPSSNVPRHRWSKVVGKWAQYSRCERRVHPARVKLQKWWKSQRAFWTKTASVFVFFCRKRSWAEKNADM